MKWTGPDGGDEKCEKKKNFSCKPEGKRPFGRRKRRWGYIKINLK